MKDKEQKISWNKLAVIIAFCSFYVSWLAYSDVRKVERLDLEPRISFSARLFPERYGIDKNLYPSSSFTIANFGAVDALQVNVEFIDVCFNKETKTISSYGASPSLKKFVDTIEPFERKNIPLNQASVNLLAYCHDQPPLDGAVLVWITYKRDPDRKTFVTRALYFVSSDGILRSDVGYYQDSDGNQMLSDHYYDTYSDMIINYSDKFGKFLEEDQRDAIYPLKIQ